MGPLETMTLWEQVAICVGLFTTMVWLQLHPSKTQQERIKTQFAREQSSEQSSERRGERIGRR